MHFPQLDEECKAVLHFVMRGCAVALQGLNQRDVDMWDHPLGLQKQVEPRFFSQTIQRLEIFTINQWMILMDTYHKIASKEELLENLDIAVVFKEMVENSQWKNTFIGENQ